MNLKKGADVFSSDGQKIGSLDRVVLNPESKEVTHLVVERGLLFTTNKVIPIQYIDLEEADRIVLEKNADELEVLPAYDPEAYIDLDNTAYPDEEQRVNSVYWYPPLHSTWWTTGGGRPGTYAKPKFVKAENVIPEDTVALKEGARVVSQDGEHVGNVEQVIVDALERRATHILLEEGLFLKERKLSSWLKEIRN